jgi:HSP20 family protein
MFSYNYRVRPARAPESLNRVIEEMGGVARPNHNGHGVRALAVDVLATDDAYILTAAIPGLRPEDLKLEVLGDTVTLRGEVAEPEAEQGHWLLRERRHGAFARTLVLPVAVDGNAAEASIEHGVLTVRLPKVAESRPKTIKVNAR